MSPLSSLIFALGALAASVTAEHTISVNNRCGYGIPTMYGPAAEAPFAQGPIDITHGFRTSTDIYAFVVYLQENERCGANAENCMMVEGSLVAGVSCADISLIPPHKFDQPVSFELTGDKQGATCNSANCKCDSDTFCLPNDYGALRCDASQNAGLTVTFC